MFPPVNFQTLFGLFGVLSGWNKCLFASFSMAMSLFVVFSSSGLFLSICHMVLSSKITMNSLGFPETHRIKIGALLLNVPFLPVLNHVSFPLLFLIGSKSKIYPELPNKIANSKSSDSHLLKSKLTGCRRSVFTSDIRITIVKSGHTRSPLIIFATRTLYIGLEIAVIAVSRRMVRTIGEVLLFHSLLS